MEELAHIQVSLASVVALLASVASGIAIVFAWLSRLAIAAVKKNLEERFARLEAAADKARAAEARAAEESRGAERAAADKAIELLRTLTVIEKRLDQHDGKILALEKSDEETHAAQTEFREKALSIGFFEKEMGRQNVMLEKQGTAIEKVVERLARTRTVSQELAVAPGPGIRPLAPPMGHAVDERRDPPTDRPFRR